MSAIEAAGLHLVGKFGNTARESGIRQAAANLRKHGVRLDLAQQIMRVALVGTAAVPAINANGDLVWCARYRFASMMHAAGAQ